MTSTLDSTPGITRSVPRPRPDLSLLREALSGDLHEPHEPAFVVRTTPWNVSVPMMPTAVVAARTTLDVIETVRFAAAAGLTVGVQATGHGAVSSLAGALLVSTCDLDEVTVHPEGWARVGAGAKWGRVTEAAAPHGLAGLCGSTSDVSVVGYLTGGGVGPMARTFGLASDRVRAFEVVTGDGELRRVTPTQHPDLYFALRGGKGAAGIVTAVEIDLVQLPTFYGGGIYFAGQDAAAVVERWLTWSADLPEQGTTSFAYLQVPDMPMVPPELAGRSTLAVRFLWTGEPDEGERLLDQMRTVAPLILDDASVRPFAAVDSVHCDPVEPMPVVERSTLLTDFPREAAEALLTAVGEGSGSPLLGVEVRQLGGALGRAGAHPCAFDHRDAAFSLLAIGIAFDPSVVPYADELLASMAAWDSGRVWPNFAPAYDADSARKAYAPGTLSRLAEISCTYDPAGVLAIGTAVRAAAAEVASGQTSRSGDRDERS